MIGILFPKMFGHLHYPLDKLCHSPYIMIYTNRNYKVPLDQLTHIIRKRIYTSRNYKVPLDRKIRNRGRKIYTSRNYKVPLDLFVGAVDRLSTQVEITRYL